MDIVNSGGGGTTTVLISLAFFAVSRHVLVRRRHSNNKSQQPHPQQQQQNNNSIRLEWKVVNTANSLLHSLITGVGALFCFWDDPRHAVDVVNSVSAVSTHLTAFSIGYFVFDVVDMVTNVWGRRSTYELLVHHAFVLLCFTTSLVTSTNLGFVMVALLIELNSVFLHWRQLLLLSGGHLHHPLRRSSRYFRTVSLLNLVTFICFRIVTLGWMTRWLVLNKHQVTSGSIYFLGCVAMATIVAMSSVLFLRLIRADLHFIRNKHSSS